MWGRSKPTGTYILIRDDLHILDMAGGLEDLAQDILSDALVQAADVQSSLVRLRRGTAEAGAAWRHHAAVFHAAVFHAAVFHATVFHATVLHATVFTTRHGRGDGCRDRVRVLGDVQRRRSHMGWVALAILAALEASRPRIGLRRRQLGRSWGSSSVSHIDSFGDDLRQSLRLEVDSG